MGSTTAYTTTAAAATTRDDVNDALRHRLAGLRLPTPIAVVSELRQVALARLDSSATGRSSRKKNR